jgi:NAD(P)-dependent dehydrogenase (short-subunit alcohol dehydrogenase family)
MAGRLEGKVAIVTGGGRGIGRGECLALAAEGARIVVNDFGGTASGTGGEKGPADQVVDEVKKMGSDAVANYDNVADFASGDRMVQQALDSFGRLDILVNNAGILRDKMLFNMTEEEWDDVLRVHLKGTFTVYRAAAAYFRKAERPGSLVAFTSGVWALGAVGQPNYAAAKGGIVSFSYSAALAMARYNVRANVIAPVARTRMSANVPAEIEEMGDPEDVAPMAVYLLSDEAQDVTGQVYTVVGNKIAVWTQPKEVRAMYADGRWKPEEIATRLSSSIKTEPLPFFAMVEGRRAAAASGERPNA